MASFLSLLLLLSAAFAAILTPSAAAAATVLPFPTTAAPKALFPVLAVDSGALQQFFNIIEALIGSGDLGNWANILNGINPFGLPFSATLFIPDADGTAFPPNHIALDPSMFSYHIVPQRLAFSDLGLFPIGSRLPTLLPNNSILITNNSASNFSLNGSPLTRPDLYLTQAVAVHGIVRILNYSSYGNATFEHLRAPPPKSHNPAPQQGCSTVDGVLLPPPPLGAALPPPPSFPQFEEMKGRRASHATRSIFEFFFAGALFTVLGTIKLLKPSQ